MKAIIAGAFDPFTAGHYDIVKRARAIFGEAIVAVAEDTGKDTMPISVRVEIARKAVEGLFGVTVEPFSGLLTDYAASKGECVLVRGVRSEADIAYERSNSLIYRSLSGIETLVMLSAPEYMHISSTAVRTLARLSAPIGGYVVAGTEELILKHYAAFR